jgi:hypothetical protein
VDLSWQKATQVIEEEEEDYNMGLIGWMRCLKL